MTEAGRGVTRLDQASESNGAPEQGSGQQRIAAEPEISLAIRSRGQAVHAAVGVIGAVHENIRRRARQAADPVLVKPALLLERIATRRVDGAERVAPPDDRSSFIPDPIDQRVRVQNVAAEIFASQSAVTSPVRRKGLRSAPSIEFGTPKDASIAGQSMFSGLAPGHRK